MLPPWVLEPQCRPGPISEPHSQHRRLLMEECLALHSASEPGICSMGITYSQFCWVLFHHGSFVPHYQAGCRVADDGIAASIIVGRPHFS
jgi:hypothetical protein